MFLKSMTAALTVAFVCLLMECSSKTDNPEALPTKADLPAPEQVDKTPPMPETMKLSASHILIMYTGAQQAPDGIKRTKDEAKALADEIHKKLLNGEDFAELAKKYSDCPSKSVGGDLGTFSPGRMTPAFSKAVMAMKVGEISAPVETPFGYHVIKRKEVEKPVTLSASFIVILHEGSVPNPLNVKRSKEEALGRAQEALAKIKAGADFAEVAKEYSDHPNRIAGGNMGNFESTAVPPEYTAAVKALKTGEVSSEPLETRLGFHIFKRQELIESKLLSASLILISYKDAAPNLSNSTRTKEEALARAKEVLGKLKGGAKFEDMVKEYSDHPNKAHGGDLGTFLSDRMLQNISEAVQSLKVGEFSKEPLDIPSGYHILLRKEAPQANNAPAQPGGAGAPRQ
jgi:NIMA-interacting peptidyl-prolyl cis-trans isomerase 1